MSLAHYVTLGRSGLRVSPFCLGAMTFGNEWSIGVGPEESFALIKAYIDAGGNFIDTANIYNNGHSEKILGDYFTKGPGKGTRDRIVIATKFMGNLYAGDPNGGGANRKSIITACEHSLRRLQTDYIDLYLAHFWDQNTPIDETMKALDFLVQQGKVRYLGFSDHPAWVCAQAQYEAIFRDWTPLVALQIEYSLLERTVEAELIPMARALGLGVTPWSPLRGGVLSGKFRRNARPTGDVRVKEDSKHLTDRAYDVIEALVEIGNQIGASPAQVALRWTQDRPGVASTIIGARRLDQLADNIAALSISLSPEHTRTLTELTEPSLPFPCDFLKMVKSGIHGGITINGETPDPWPLQPKTDGERW